MPDKTEMMTSGVPSAEQPEDIGNAIAPMSEPNQTPSEELTPTEQSRQKFTNIRSDQRVVTIERDAAVQTQADTQMKYLLELLASLRSKHVLTGKLEGVEMSESSGPRASLYYGDFKVLIPFSELMDDPASYRDMNPNDVMRYLIAKRLGAEIDFVVRGIDQEANLVVASRKDAMAIRRRQFFFGQDRDGNNLLYEGAVAEARVVSVIRTGIFVELFGVESYIGVQELSYQRILDAGRLYMPGQRVLVKILTLSRGPQREVQVTLSVKQTQKNPYDSIAEKYTPGNHYIGTVTMVDVNGVFVALDGGVDCLCMYPARGIPLIGSRVTVRIYKVDPNTGHINGDIIHTAGRIE